jgi:cytochrome d ubiquinol oxidase subunit I
VGLEEFAAADRPDDGLVNAVHFSFQAMVAIGLSLAALGAVFWLAAQRGRDLLASRRFLRVAVLAGPAAVAAVELGWMTTELGRQPWVVYRTMRVVDAVTTGSGVWISLAVVIVVYTGMTIAAALVLRSMAARWRAGDPLDLPTPYSPIAGGVRRRRRPGARV